ncbi:MAG: alpha-amylase family protein, partial [Planctomycetota bacterium]
CEKHPDWISRLPDGSPVVHRPDLPRKKLCFNSPYADAYLVRALELVDLGVDGFYFDSWHQSKKGCWCGYCKKKFKQETGLDLPKKIKPADPVYRKLLEYKNVILERTFLRYRKEFHKRNPNLVMIVGSNTWPSMSDTHQNSRLWRIVDSQKTEFTLASRANLPKKMLPFNKNVKNVHGWVLARDATGGRPPHIWIPRLRDESTVTYSAAAAVAHGCIANSDNGGDQIPNSMFKKAYQFGDSVSPYFAGTKPLRYVALHYSEHARKSYTTDKYQAWANVLYPNYAAFLALLRARLPVGIVTDSQLEDDLLNDFQVLFIPDRKNLTAKMKSVVNDFKAKGGQVIYNSPDYKWHQADGQQAAIKKFIAQIETGPTTPPVKVTGGPNKMQTDSFLNKEKNRLTVTCVNDFSWIKLEILKNATPEQKRKTKQIKLPKPCSGAKIILKGKFAAEPKKLFNAVIGKELNFTKVGDAIKVDVPDFEALAVVVAQY